MTLTRLRNLKALSLMLAFILTCSMAFAAPAAKGSKSRKSSASAKKKVAGKKSSSRSKRVSAKSRSSRSKKIAHKSRRGGRLIGRKGRGRGSRSRWRSRDASASLAYRSSGIKNFLTDSWASSTPTGSRQAPVPAANQGLTPLSSAPAPAAAKNPDPTAPANPDATTAPPRDQGLVDAIPQNPLVLAYAESLAARGFDAENQGFIVSTIDGEVLAEHNADRQFNPASVIKVATSLTAISRLGPDFRYRTSLYTDGIFDPSTGTLNGSLYVIGSGDPAFFYENVMLIADKLKRNGIRVIEGDLVVLGPFYFNFSASREASAKAFRTCLTNDKWTAASRRAYSGFIAMRAAEERSNTSKPDAGARSYYSSSSSEPPSIKITGKTLTDAVVSTSGLKLLAVHTSLPLVRMLKGLNDFSNNWMANVIGNLVGGPDAVQRFLETEVGLKGEELNIVTASGLGSNYISPRATIQILRKLMIYLNSRGLQLEAMLPVAGIDAGTLQRRFTDAYRGSVVAKTGTLSSVSALAGVAYTRGKGPLLFVIYNRGGSTHTFRSVQDETIKKLITLFGGPAPVRYSQTMEPSISSSETQPDRPTTQK